MLAWLDRALDPAEELGPVGLVLVDLDGFKDVNTVLGYPEGDRVLCETARVLEGCVRGDDMVAAPRGRRVRPPGSAGQRGRDEDARGARSSSPLAAYTRPSGSATCASPPASAG